MRRCGHGVTGSSHDILFQNADSGEHQTKNIVLLHFISAAPRHSFSLSFIPLKVLY